MQFDIFFSISQTPVGGESPDESTMFANFFEQVEAADELGFGTAWIAEAHLSSEIQKRNRKPVIPHWHGEVGLNCDFLQLAQRVFARTKRIEAGSAVMNILCNGGPIAHAERIASFLAIHGLDPDETRRIHVGFAAGRFDFNNAATGVCPRNPMEDAYWPAVKGRVFEEASHILLRLLRGDTISSEDIPQQRLRRESFRSEEDWLGAQRLAETDGDEISVQKFWPFEELKIIPQEFRRDLMQLVIGSHDPAMQNMANEYAPVQVFNLSITNNEIIEQTHARMQKSYHSDGGAWQRGHMPRTVFVFVNDEHATADECRKAAAQDAEQALSAYWTALEGTLDPTKVERASENALVGSVEDVAAQIAERFHPEDRLMLWFDFFNHDSARVVRNMEAFMGKVVPKLEELLG
jgi:alkanesulfonate monooxygenase SsuD/methylene tetrahydromethanopterin reductase-like flavin-dependent oxidoreductase (luciferase family)